MAAGYDWLLLGNGRGYSWRELSLDHASQCHSLESIKTRSIKQVLTHEDGNICGVCSRPWCPLTSARGLEGQYGSGGGQGAGLSAVCQTPEPSL